MFKRIILSLLGLFFVCAFLSAQIPTGKIYGTVTDEEGTPLPGVSVEAKSPKLIGKAATITDTNGIYRLFNLTPGEYRITFTLQGFKPFIRENIIVHVEETLRVDIKMQMGAIEEEVTVVGQSPLIDVKSTTKGMTLTKDMFLVLPRGRNFDTLVTAVPGVNQEPWLGGLSIDGASGAENMFYIDGTDIGKTDVGTRGQSAAFEFVDEVKVVASGYPAEFGGAIGGVVTVVTRQGGNEYHGELIGYYDGSKLTGKERDTVRLSPLNDRVMEIVNYEDMYGKQLRHRIEAGFNLSGYIIKDKLWFFGSLLPVFEPYVRHIKFISPVVSADYMQNNYANNFQGKITAQVASFLRMGVSYVNNFTKYKGNLPSRDGTGSAYDIYSEYGFSYPNYTFQGFADFTFGNNMMINLRGGRFYYNTMDQLVHATYTRQQLAGRGIGVYLPSTDPRYRARNWQNRGRIFEVNSNKKYKNHIEADFTYYLNLFGEHALRAGVSWVRQGEIEDNQLDAVYSEVFFNWDRPCIVGGVNYGRGTYGYYEVRGSPETGKFGGLWDVYNNRYAVYIQDSWTLLNRITVNFGLRAETEFLPAYTTDIPPEISKDWKPMEFDWDEKLAPRVGFVYDMFGDASLKIFGTYGLYYDVIKTYMAAHSYSGFKWKSAYYTLDTLDWEQIGPDHNYLGTHLLTYDWRHPSFTTTDPNLKPVSQREFTLGVEKSLLENLALTVRFVQKHLRYAIEDVGFIEPGVGEVYYEANPGYGYTLWTTHGGKMDPSYPETPKAKREYYAVNFSLDKRLANNWLAGLSYTWSSLRGNYSGLASSEEYGRVSPYVERLFDNWAMSYTKELELVDGPLHTDRPHFFKFYGAYTFPFHLTLGTVINAMSGTPVSETWSVLSTYWYPFNRGKIRDENGNIVSKRTPFLWFMNAYAEYNLRWSNYTLNFNVNVDNVFNIKTARRIYDYRTLYGLNVDEDMIRDKAFDLDTPGVGHVEHPMWLAEMDFYPAISIRFGTRFSF